MFIKIKNEFVSSGYLEVGATFLKRPFIIDIFKSCVMVSRQLIYILKYVLNMYTRCIQ